MSARAHKIKPNTAKVSVWQQLVPLSRHSDGRAYVNGKRSAVLN